MLTNKIWLERAVHELIEIRDEIRDLATDRDIYWKVQHEVIQKNVRLLTIRSAFFDMLNNAYAHATAARIRRLMDKDRRTVSLRRLLGQLVQHTDLVEGKISRTELQSDIESLEKTASRVTEYVDQYVAHHDHAPTVKPPTHRELNQAIDMLIEMLRKYYAALGGADVDVVVRYLHEPLEIFRFAWIDETRR